MGEFKRQWFEGREQEIPGNKLETNIFNQYQGDFLISQYHLDPYRYAAQRHHLDNMQKMYGLKINLAVTHTDVGPEHHCSSVIDSIDRTLKETLLIQNIYTSNNSESNFKLYASKLN